LFGVPARLESLFQGGTILRFVAQAVFTQRIKALRVHAPASKKFRRRQSL
jgi:hypothetical protein